MQLTLVMHNSKENSKFPVGSITTVTVVSIDAA